MSSKFVLQQEDGTVENGNARGAYSVDLQMSRTAADQVAFGTYGFIGGGKDNKIQSNGDQIVIAGGQGNIAGRDYATIGGGLQNSILATTNGSRGTIGGGQNNIVSSDYSTISGGESNTASTNTHATVVGGYLNTASGQYSVVGGFGNTNSGGRGSLVVGYQNTSTDQGAFVSGQGNTNNGRYTLVSGLNNIVSQIFGTAVGQKAKSYIIGQSSIGNDFGSSRGISANQGDFQSSNLNVFNQDSLSSGGTLTLNVYGYLTGTIPLLIPDGTNRAWNVQVKTVAVVTAITGTATGVSVGDTLMQDDKLLFSKVSGVSSIVGTTSQDFISSTSLGTASMSYSAGASQELALTFTAPTFAGGGSVTMRVVSKVELVEVAF